jgi:uncharacterized protein (UPF0332 family)
VGAREDAASRLYYAVFHAARAALTVRGRYAKTHSGQITAFETTFGREPLLRRLFELRGKADYGRDPFTPSIPELEGVAQEAAGVIERCRRLVAEAVAAGPDEPDPAADY